MTKLPMCPFFSLFPSKHSKGVQEVTSGGDHRERVPPFPSLPITKKASSQSFDRSITASFPSQERLPYRFPFGIADFLANAGRFYRSPELASVRECHRVPRTLLPKRSPSRLAFDSRIDRSIRHCGCWFWIRTIGIVMTVCVSVVVTQDDRREEESKIDNSDVPVPPPAPRPVPPPDHSISRSGNKVEFFWLAIVEIICVCGVFCVPCLDS